MGFDKQAFLQTSFTDRTEEVSVPDLAPWFGGDREAAVWVVRGLTGAELAAVNEAAERARDLGAIVEGLVSPERREKVDAIRALLGIRGDTPADLVKRLEMAALGSVEPKIETDLAIRLAENYPVEFFLITNAITRLTGQGRVPGNLPGSGETPASE